MRELGGLALLESAGMEPVLREVALVLYGPLSEWSLLRVHHRPGVGATGIYSIRYRHANDVFRGFLGVTTAAVPEATYRSLRLRGATGEELVAWSHPQDPLLPGLPWASDTLSVGTALFGTRITELATVSYRPLRRAVLRAAAGNEVRYLKVLRRDQGSGLRARHSLLLEAGVPVPCVVNSPEEDVVVTEAATGVPLASSLMEDGAGQLDPFALVELLQRLPDAAMDLPVRKPWSARITDYARGATAVLPTHEGRILEMADEVRIGVTSTAAGPLVPAHGDFYEGNLLVEGGQITGLLDVDVVGPGHLVDDLACFLAHLAVLPCVDARYIHIPKALERFRSAFGQVVDGTALDVRAAGVALTLVAGAKKFITPGRGAPPWEQDARGRLRVAEAFLAAARG